MPSCTTARRGWPRRWPPRGVGHGDRVALLLHNGFEFPESLLACHRLGAVAVPINFRLTADEIAYILEDSGAAALIAGDRPDGWRDAVSSRSAPRTRRRSPAAEPAPQADVDEHDPALLCYTSGTTGRPKGAVLTHGNLVAGDAELDPRDAAPAPTTSGSPGSRCSTSAASTGCCRS